MPVKNGKSSESGIAVVDRPAAGEAVALQNPVETRALGGLLQMADGYRAAHALRQAEELYLHLHDTHPDSSQAAQARERLLEICAEYERDGQLHHARWLYERLL